MTTTIITQIPVDQIHPHPANPRRDLGDLTELADSIRAQGVRQNLLVVPSDDPHDAYMVVIGHRRLAAAKAAGLDTIPCVIDRQLDAAGQIELMLVENLQRADLTPIEEATGYQDLLDLGMTEPDIRKTTGRARATVKARLRLLELPETAQAKVHAGQATLEDAARAHKLLEQLADTPDAAAVIEEALASLGTKDFDWQIRRAQEDVKLIAKQREWIDKLEAHGIPAQPEDTDRDAWQGHDWVFDERNLEKILSKPAQEGATWRRTGSYIEIEVPAAETAEDKAAAKEARKAKIDAENAAREQRREDARLADQLRKEFVLGFVQRQRVTPKQVDLILPLVRHAPSSGRWDFDKWLKETEIDEDALHPAQWLLAFAVTAVAAFWEWTKYDSRLADTYRVLAALGYTLSNTEQTWLDEAARLPAEGDGR